MNDILTIVPLAASAYVATNLDNLTLLVTLLARYEKQTPLVAAGYLSCVLLLGLAGFWIGTAAVFAPVEYLGLLGLVPISIGVAGLVRLRQRPVETSLATDTLIDSGRTVFVTTLVSQLSNGADTVVTFAALFADSNAATDMLIVFTFAVMAAIFLLVAIYGVRHPALNVWIERYAERLTPYILIIVGAYIVANTATDLLPG